MQSYGWVKEVDNHIYDFRRVQFKMQDHFFTLMFEDKMGTLAYIVL